MRYSRKGGHFELQGRLTKLLLKRDTGPASRHVVLAPEFARRACGTAAAESSRAGYCFATCARRRALGCGSAAIRTPVSRFPPSPAACIGGRSAASAQAEEAEARTLGKCHVKPP